MGKDDSAIIKYFKSLLLDPKVEAIPEWFYEIEGLEEIDFLLRNLREAIMDIGKGNLDRKIQGQGYMIGTAKNLQATLKNLIWHSKAISRGDFSQEVSFLGDFSEAFNIMTMNIAKMFLELEASEERHRLLADNASDVVWTMNPEGNINYISPSVEKIRGYSVEEVMAQSIEEMVCPSSIEKLVNNIEFGKLMVENGLPFKVFRSDIEIPCKDGSTIWADLTISGIYDKNNNFLGMLGVYKDITERKNMENEIKVLLETDKLTQISNRLKLDETLKMEMKRFLRGGLPFAVILLDIDYFKKVNDEFGHLVGDEILKEVAEIVNLNVRETDLAGRWGGEEFLIITPTMEEKSAKLLAEKIRKKILDHEFAEIGHLTASFGVADSKGLADEVKLVLRADLAMYKAKNAGRNQVYGYSETK